LPLSETDTKSRLYILRLSQSRPVCKGARTQSLIAGESEGALAAYPHSSRLGALHHPGGLNPVSDRPRVRYGRGHGEDRLTTSTRSGFDAPFPACYCSPPMQQAIPRSSAGHFLHTPADLLPIRRLVARLGIVLFLLCAVIAILWFDRDGLIDHHDGDVSFSDVVYFTMITITTVGYGDITPVTPRARLIDALIVTPVRIAVWLMFLGTAYQLIIRRYMEGYRMATLKAGLQGHIIVCGFGNTGTAAVKELLAKGTDPAKILVVDHDEVRARAATGYGVSALQEDCTQEATMKDAVVEKAKALIIAAGRDDTTALILLTARHLNPMIRIIVSAKEEENIKLFRQGGANSIVAPATFGGYALAAAVDQSHMVQYLEDLLTAGGRVNLLERQVGEDEIGKTAADLKPAIVLRVYRGTSVISMTEVQAGAPLQRGDLLVMLKPTA
jgi:voltage-gated potassium channel